MKTTTRVTSWSCVVCAVAAVIVAGVLLAVTGCDSASGDSDSSSSGSSSSGTGGGTGSGGYNDKAGSISENHGPCRDAYRVAAGVRGGVHADADHGERARSSSLYRRDQRSEDKIRRYGDNAFDRRRGASSRCDFQLITQKQNFAAKIPISASA